MGSTLSWSVGSNQNWLTAQPSSGELNFGESIVVDIRATSVAPANVKQARVTVDGGDGGSEAFDVFLGCASPTSPASTQLEASSRKPGDLYTPNQLLVRYKEVSGLTALQALIEVLEAKYNYRTLSSGQPLGPDLIEFEDDVETMATLLNSDLNIVYAEPNKYADLLALTPNDPLYRSQWNMEDFGLPQAWDRETGDAAGGRPPVVVAILDSAVQTDHEDLASKTLPGCDFHDDDADPSSPLANNVHGTHVAGIALGTGNNNLGIAGVAFGNRVELVPVKVFNNAGTTGSLLDLANAIRWSAGLQVVGYTPNPNPARILNMSLGALNTSVALNEAVADAVTAGVLVFAASGNDGFNNALRTPANAPDAIAVGSVNSNFLRSSFSNHDITGGKSVDIMGPGGTSISNVLDCSDRTIISTFPMDNYGCLAGTSMATPFVAGVAALVWYQNPNFSALQVKNRLLNSTFFDNSWDSDEYGSGVICADEALGAATSCGN